MTAYKDEDTEIVPVVCLSINPKSNTYYVWVADTDRKMHIYKKIQNPVNGYALFTPMIRALGELEDKLLEKAGQS